MPSFCGFFVHACALFRCEVQNPTIRPSSPNSNMGNPDGLACRFPFCYFLLPVLRPCATKRVARESSCSKRVFLSLKPPRSLYSFLVASALQMFSTVGGPV